MNSEYNDWADFSHTTKAPAATAYEVFERFREFQILTDNLSRKELVARQWLKSEDDMSPLATVFFSLPLSRQPTLFRKSASADKNLLAIWQTRARIEAEIRCVADQCPTFSGLNKKDLRKLASLSVDPQVVRELPDILSGSGVILVYVYALPGMKTDGAVFHLATGHPVVAMSLRFPRLDYFWFTLLHELAHIVLHNDKLKEPLFFDVEDEEVDLAEKAANRLAKDSLVDRNSWRNCAPKYHPSQTTVRDYASEQGVHPSIVAGLLTRETGNYARFSNIINEHNVRDIIFHP